MPDVTTVGDLLDYLATQPRDRPVVLAKNPEGNSYSPLYDADEVMYLADSTYSGAIYMTPEALDRVIALPDSNWSLEEDGAPDEAVRAVCLGPVN